MNALVSIIMPVYNAEKYIEKAIESVFCQTYQPIELIIVNDGSNDRSLEVIKYCMLKSPSYIDISYNFQKNQGASTARNFGIGKSKGQYIAFLDADDYYGKHKIENQVKLFESERDIDVVYNDVQIINTFGEPINVMKAKGKFASKEDLLVNMIFRQFIPAPASIMLRRECFGIVTYNPKLTHSEDYDFTIRLAQTFNLRYSPTQDYFCRRHNSNLSNNLVAQQIAEKKIINELGIQYISDIVKKTTYTDYVKDLLYSKIMLKIDRPVLAEHRLVSLYVKEKSSELCFYLGNISYLFKRFDIAKEYYKEAIQMNTSMAEAFNNLGCIYRLLNEEKKAIKYIQKAMELRPNYMDACKNLSSENISLTNKELREELLSYNN